MIARRARTKMLALTMMTALATSACLGAPADEEVGDSSQEISTARCSSAKVTTTATVKVMTINLRNESDQWERRFPLIADEIERLDPDIIGLQEVQISQDQANVLNDLLQKRGHAKYHLFTHRKSGWRGWFSGEGIGIMSRWPIVKEDHEDTGEMRVSVHARIKHPSGAFLDMADTHLDHHGGAEGDADRDDEARQTVDLITRNDDCRPTFLTGDMNATESSSAVKRFLSAGFVDSYKQVHGAAETAAGGNTAMIKLADGAFEQHPSRRIDFVLGQSAGPRTIKPVASEVCFNNHDARGFYPSDHLGVMTTFEIKL